MYSYLKHIKNFLLKVTGINKLKKLMNTMKVMSVTFNAIETITITTNKRLERLEALIDIVEKRTQTLEFLSRHSQYILNHQIDQQLKFYVELFPYMEGNLKGEIFDLTKDIELNTDFPIALQSNDHLMPDSTAEGLSRPTQLVRHCIDLLGVDIKALDIGTGAAGLVYEWTMNGVLAAGLDGSDFCRKNKIGYWPLLPNNLFTCDITKPFNFLSVKSGSLIDYDIVTSWEVLEHIAQSDLQVLFENIRKHLKVSGYFIGSVSLIDYADPLGNPYHVTLKPRIWWKGMFEENGLTMLDKHPFNESLFCRGNGPRFQDFHNYKINPEAGFLFVAKKII